MYEILLSIIIYANHSTKTMYVKKYLCRGRLVNKRQRYECVGGTRSGGEKWKGRHCSHLKEGKKSRPDFRQAREHVPQERHNRQSALILAKRGPKSWRRAPGTAENSRFCAHKAQLYIRDRAQLYNLKSDERQDYIDGQGLSSGWKIRI